MKIEKPEQFPTKEILELQISDSLECSSRYSEKGKISFKLVDVNGDELSIEELIGRYFSNPEDCIVTLGKEDTKQDIVQANNEQKHDTGKREHLEEHISKPENDDILHLVLENNQNNIEARANIVRKMFF